MKFLLFGFFCLPLWLGCGAPAVGEKCSGGGYRCQDRQSALECRDGLWTAIPCRGAAGCADSDGEIACDVGLNLAGDPCPDGFNGRSICDPALSGVLECREGVFVQIHACLSCQVQNGEVRCTQ